MKKLRAFIWAFFVSPEFLVVVAAFFSVFPYPQPWFQDLISLDGEKAKYVGLLPSIFVPLVFTMCRKIEFPEKDPSSLIQEWEDYDKLDAVLIASKFYSILFSAGGICLWLFKLNSSNAALELMAFSILGGGITFWTVHRAESKINRVVITKGAAGD